MLGWLTKIVGDSNEREIERLSSAVADTNDLEQSIQSLTDGELRDKTDEFRQRLNQGETLDDLLPDTFAVVRESAVRRLGMRHFDVQLMGGIALHQGKIAEMRTGEGKTLVATLPLYLNALTGEGCHLVTVNDYLAKRDAVWMGPIFHALGLTVGVIQHESGYIYDPDHPGESLSLQHLNQVSRKDAYDADITYGTNNEFGFDYLRDNMVVDLSQRVQRARHFAIVDEVDNILIDEARTPLIISGQAEQATDQYQLFARLVPKLSPDQHFTIDEKSRTVSLTEQGIEAVESALGIGNLYAPDNFELTHYLEQALKAQFIFERDVDYVLYLDGEVLGGARHHALAEIVIVDEFTGRLMIGRRYSDGLHQAIEAKERVRIQRESQTMATITFQNYFRMYEKLAGMTGTATTEKEEFARIYNLVVVSVPTHRPMVREDSSDQVYKSEDAKYAAAVDEILLLNEQQTPVLVGTTSIEKSEHLGDLLKRQKIAHQVLNAKYHEQEAEIVAQAGRPSAVTIATNMAGRGVDILLGGNPEGLVEEYLRKAGLTRETATEEQVADALNAARSDCERDGQMVRGLGGLHIIGTERHEARRIDNQLRGRAGRQGDPGSSRFYLSLKDELMRRFGGPNIADLMSRFGMQDNVPIEHDLVSKAIENAQTRVEGHNFDLRKHVVEYDDVVNKQRAIIYSERHKVLSDEDLRSVIIKMASEVIDDLVETHTVGNDSADWDLETLATSIAAIMPTPAEFSADTLAQLNRDELTDYLKSIANWAYETREVELGADLMRRAERLVLLNVIDRNWVGHLTAIDELRQGIGLRAYGQRDPLVEYKSEAYNMFQGLLAGIRQEVVHAIFHVALQSPPIPRQSRRLSTSVSDNGGAASAVSKRVGRNHPCPCGSGRKYKRCHGRIQA